MVSFVAAMAMKRPENVIVKKTEEFADRILKMYKYLLARHSSDKDMLRQVYRSGTSIGANNAESISAISKQDYRSKSFIALKEARESLYWINLLHRNKYLTDEEYKSIYADCEEPTNEASAETKLAWAMPCKEEEDEVNW